MIRTLQLDQALGELDRVSENMRVILKKAQEKAINELEPMKKRLERIPESQIDEEDLLRFEAKDKMIQKMRKDALDIFRTALRFSADLYILLGKFTESARCLAELAEHGFADPNCFAESLAHLGQSKKDMIPDEVKKFTWTVCSQIGSTVMFARSLSMLRESTQNNGRVGNAEIVRLGNSASQIYFISCYAYFYLCLHTPRRQSNAKILKDLCTWLTIGPTTAPVHGIPRYHSALSRVCRSPFALVHFLEIFKKTKNHLDQRERTVADLLQVISEKHNKNDREFERWTNRVIRKTVTTQFPVPHFRAEHF